MCLSSVPRHLVLGQEVTQPQIELNSHRSQGQPTRSNQLKHDLGNLLAPEFQQPGIDHLCLPQFGPQEFGDYKNLRAVG